MKVVQKLQCPKCYSRLIMKKENWVETPYCVGCGHISQFNYQGRTRKYGGFLKLKAIIYSVYECKECYCKWIIKGDE